jgi:tetratricopeptide (TPR) repeat protein
MTAHEQTLAAGLQQHQAGHFAAAEALYRQVVAAEPDNADARNLLGAVYINLHQFTDAEEHLAAAVRLNPQHFAALDNHGVLLARQERYAEAAECFRRALAIAPDQFRTHLNLAAALERCGQTDEAIETYQRAAQLSPNMLRTHQELVRLFHAQGHAEDAVEHLAHVARLQPSDAKARFELADAYARLGRATEAIAAYRETLTIKPDSAEACVNLADLLSAAGRVDEAVGLLRRAIAIRPTFAEAYLNLGCALTRQQKYAEAFAALTEAARLKPELTEVHNNLGVLYNAQGRYADAAECYQRALELRPDNVDAIYNLGIALLKQKMVASALDQFEQALELAPDYAEAHHNRSAALLLSENFEEGFAEYEWRFKSRDFVRFQMHWPQWEGQSLAGRTIVLAAEQGLGDTIQFVRYAALVKEQGARVIVACPAALHPLLARTPGVDQWITTDDATVTADYGVPLLSLPYRLGTTHDTIPAKVPYVFAEHAREESWRQRLAAYNVARPGEELKVGIVWQGNRHCPGDEQRSISLAHFAPVASVPGMRLISLQKGPGTEQLSEYGQAWNIVDFGDELDAAGGAFMDTAAIMRNLDLAITSDTAAAHLAGALGVETWVALCAVPDWRWMLERDDSPWYPTMRLFRQEEWGDWSGVFERMAEQLTARTANTQGVRP